MTNSPASAPEPQPAGRPSPALIVFLLFPVLGILAAIITAVLNGTSPGVAPVFTPAPVALPTEFSLINQPAPNFELLALDGERYRLSSYRGRVTFVNFWATWCPPCERELPAFQQFTQAQPTGGAVILAVNVGEPSDQILTYFKQRSISGLTVLLDTNLDVFDAYAVQDKLPTTFVIDRGGVVRYKHLGEMKLDDLNAYVKELSG
jgi:thiol-disulfide isomerase/thioredoxin